MDYAQIPSSYIFYFFALLVAISYRWQSFRSFLMLLAPVIALIQVMYVEAGNHHQVEFFNLQIEICCFI